MITQRMRMMVAAGFLVTMTPAWAGPATQTGWRTFRSADYGFRIDYPRTMSFYPGGPVRPPEKSMFPICDEGTAACFEYNGHALDRTQIQAIGLSVNVLREDKTEADCSSIETDSRPIRSRTIHGTLFHYADAGDGGLGSSRSVSVYRTLHDGVCFEVALVTAQSDLSGQDMKDAGLRPANPGTLRRLTAAMNQMLESFAFVGPVKDGAGWSRFNGSDCGEEFEYPASAAVENVVPSSPFLFNAWGLSCLDRFTYGGRQYAVAAKENLLTRDAMDEWLGAAGFPRLSEMNVIADGPSYKEYRNPEIVYFVHGTSLFSALPRRTRSRTPLRPFRSTGTESSNIS